MQTKTPLGVRASWLAGLFLLSCAFPLAASLLQEAARPAWLGKLDVALAFVVVVSGLWLDYGFGKQVTPEHRAEAYDMLAKASIAIIVVMGSFIFFNELLDWQVLVVGWGWRAWLLIYALPAWLAFRGQ